MVKRLVKVRTVRTLVAVGVTATLGLLVVACEPSEPSGSSSASQAASGSGAQTGASPTAFAGNWLFRGVAGQNCSISQQGSTIAATTEKGVTGQGRVTGPNTFYVDFPGMGRQTATLSADRTTITWSNGETWRRACTNGGVNLLNVCSDSANPVASP